MAMKTFLLTTSNAVKLHGVSFFSSFSGRPNHFLARPLPWLMTRGVQTSCSYRETSLKAVSPELEPSVSDGIGIVRFLKGKTYLLTGATGFLGKGKTNPKKKQSFLHVQSKLIFRLVLNLFCCSVD